MRPARVVSFACLVLTASCSDTKRNPDTPTSSAVPNMGTGAQPSAWAAGLPPTKARECKAQAGGKDYEVGPSAQYKHLIDVPWESLGPGDSVRIHYDPAGYHEKFLISQSGNDKSPILICGIAGPKGERPIIDGADAKTRPAKLHAYTYEPQQERGLVIVSLDTNDRYGFKPSHIVIQGLEFKHAHPDYSFTNSLGEKKQFMAHTAALFIERGEDIVVRDCAIDDNANGYFVASGGDEATQSRRMTFESNLVYGNGTTGQGFDRRHNIYAESVGMIFQYNRIGPLRDGAGGSALKDRSAGTIVRYNWIEGGSRSLDLVEAEDGWEIEKASPDYNTAWVYGNVIVSGPEGASNVVHWGGDNGLEEKYRKGTLYFYGNTVVMRADQQKRWRTSVFELATNDQTVDARNNVFYATSQTPGAPPTNLALMNQAGVGRFAANLSSPFESWAEGREIKGKVEGIDRVKKLDVGDSPFRDLATNDLRPREGSALIGAVVDLANGVPPLDREYVDPLDSKARTPKDLGAFEH